MLGRVFGIICIIAFIFAAATGNLQNMSNAVLDGAAGAVSLTISLVGIMCLWCGVMQVFSDAGVIRRLSRLLSPLLRVFFPTAYRTGRGAEEITANISANLLGIGNAATPLAISAMRKMQEDNDDPSSASADMITLAVLNTASVSVLPSTLIALRRAAGSEQPYSVVLPVWICSLSCALLALLLTRAAAAVSAARGRKNGSCAARADCAPNAANGVDKRGLYNDTRDLNGAKRGERNVNNSEYSAKRSEQNAKHCKQNISRVEYIEKKRNASAGSTGGAASSAPRGKPTYRGGRGA